MAKHAGDEGDGHKDGGEDRELLHDYIEPIGNRGQVHIEHATHQVTVGIEHFKRTDQVVVYIREIGLGFGRNEFPGATHQRIGDFDLRADGTAHLR